MEDNTDVDYAYAKTVWNRFFKKNLEECHDLYAHTDTLLLADVFDNFRNMYLEIYELDPTKFLLATGLAWQAALKKDKIKIRFLN